MSPSTLDGEALPAHELIAALGATVGAYGFGRIDMVENRRVGIKSREVYECPGALALIMAHADLEGVCLERDVMREKGRLESRFAELVYDGLWHSPLRRALEAFMIDTQEHVTGEVRLALDAGRCYVSGRRAPKGLYDHGLATYDAVRHVPPPRRRGLRAPVGPVGRDVGPAPGSAGARVAIHFRGTAPDPGQ